ncbi:uncharacterized protein L201_000289 [Kwoniella dendrophila CBS 6074]|uniref:C2H2-type domain-containing protein n=1 Tax=Kwoniella dendrophila CBS 6074 TaxID=1295534 RepID=A0AAX4JIZ1_9TREE
MPVDVTPTPIHPHSLPPVSYHRGWSSIPVGGPARVIEILPGSQHQSPPVLQNQIQGKIPGSIMPNGLRNPWAAYSGETYKPSSENVLNKQIQLQPDGSVSNYGGGGGRSIIAPPSFYGGGGGSMIRDDEGWNGSLGRNHHSHNPDLSSVGHIGPTIPTSAFGGSQAGWAPSSYVNHARMTPPLSQQEMYHPSPPIMNSGASISHTHSQPLPIPKRRSSADDYQPMYDCRDCRLAKSHSSRHGRTVSFSGHNNSNSRGYRKGRSGCSICG